MADYTNITTALVHLTRSREDALPLKNELCRSQLFLHDKPTSKVCVFFHGFTAAPYQFVSLGLALFRLGYNVLIPLMPGHGKAGTFSETNPPPLPQDPTVYKDFGRYWYEQAKTLGDKVVVGGLSGGGTLAAWLALEYPTIYRTVLFAPYFSSSSRVIDMFTRGNKSYFAWGKVDQSLVPGYIGFMVPALRVFLTMGGEILKRVDDQAIAPTFTISSESDVAVGNQDHRALFERGLKRQPKCWYHRFDRVLDIPHTMMTEAEGNKYENLLNTMARSYIDSDLTWAEVEEIGYRMAQGKTFPAVVAELNLAAKVSRDMPAMMTMVDKRSILEKRMNRRSPSNR